MLSADLPENSSGETPSTAQQAQVAESDSTSQPTLIADLIAQPDFPKSAVGRLVDIGGYVGVVAEVINQSLKVRSPDGGGTKSFNAHGLRKIYGHVEKPEIPQSSQMPDEPRPAARAKVASPWPDPEPAAPPARSAPRREVIEDPDFEAEVKNITEYVNRQDFPRCVFGKHVEIADYSGVVVELVQESLKVRSIEGATRSYNAPALRRLYGKGGSHS